MFVVVVSYNNTGVLTTVPMMMTENLEAAVKTARRVEALRYGCDQHGTGVKIFQLSSERFYWEAEFRLDTGFPSPLVMERYKEECVWKERSFGWFERVDGAWQPAVEKAL